MHIYQQHNKRTVFKPPSMPSNGTSQYPRSSLCAATTLHILPRPQPPDSRRPEFCVNHTLAFWGVCVCVRVRTCVRVSII